VPRLLAQIDHGNPCSTATPAFPRDYTVVTGGHGPRVSQPPADRVLSRVAVNTLVRSMYLLQNQNRTSMEALRAFLQPVCYVDDDVRSIGW
jgi:hypothetical protein